MLSKKELKKYSRQITLSEIGKEGQIKLKNAHVLVVGAGGLGCPVVQYLSAMGVKHIGVVDNDKVEMHNLHRQVLFGENDIGEYKADVVKSLIEERHPEIELITYREWLNSSNVLDILDKWEYIVDGTDNFTTKYLLNDACVVLDKPMFSASILRFEGQVSVFNFQNGPTYRCLFPEAPSPENSPSCEEAGVAGFLPGIIGSMLTNEIIKAILGIGEVLSGKLLVYNSLNNEMNVYEFATVSENKKIENIKEENIQCSGDMNNKMKNIEPEELKELMSNGEEVSIIDVREPYEVDICNIGGTNIPLNELPHNVDRIPSQNKVAFLCHHGIRSQKAIEYLKREKNFDNLYNINGGIHKWAQNVDPELPVY
ncbi:MAG: ThiF family adenylyltransferase [Flavobacteriales bacterium]